jgi:hypothetical protein
MLSLILVMDTNTSQIAADCAKPMAPIFPTFIAAAIFRIVLLMAVRMGLMIVVAMAVIVATVGRMAVDVEVDVVEIDLANANSQLRV